jgi:hypothetical protein
LPLSKRSLILSPKHFAALFALLAVVLIAGEYVLDRSGSEAGVGVSRAAGFESREARTVIQRAAEVLARAEARQQRREERLRRLRPFLTLPAGVSRSTLEAIASCESGGDPTIVSADGLYHGKYQFSPATWAAVGGSGLPSEAPEVEQDYRAALLYVTSGPGQWPVCGS